MANTRKKKTKKTEEKNRLPWIIGGIVVAVLVFFALSRTGIVGIFIGNLLSFLFGSYAFVPLICALIYCFYAFLFKDKHPLHRGFLPGLIVLNAAVIMLSGVLADDIQSFPALKDFFILRLPDIPKGDGNFGGGLLGNFLYATFRTLFDRVGSIIVLVVLFLIAALLIVPFNVYKSSAESLSRSVKDAHAQAQEERQRRREEKEENERIRRERIMMEENAKPIRGSEFTFIDDGPVIEPEVLPEEPEEAPVINEPKVDRSDVLSKKSKYFINLEEETTQTPNEAPLTILTEVKKEKEAIEEEERLEKEEAAKPRKSTPVRKKKGVYHFPPLSLLETYTGKSSSINKNSADVKGEKLLEILRNFDIEAELVGIHIGPSVTKFEVKPDSSVKVDRIMNISNNIKMELAAKEIRIEAPIPGRSAVGIEVPNVEPIPVKMLELMRNFPKNSSKLSFALGKGLMGDIFYCDITKMPHLLIAGATGSGKSVCINTIITSFLFRVHPDELKLVLIDPKKVEFTPYHDIPHLLWPVITDTNMACTMLEKATVIMEERYDTFAEAGVRNIQAYNDYIDEHNANLSEGEEKLQKMPYIVIIIDELADLMAVAKKEVQLSIQRITQLARACGMHLIVATQRPSVDVITGIIKSNIPSRISFAVASQTDSRTILDKAGAEKLLGYGDMLYLPQGESTPIRIQGCFVTDAEVRAVTKYAKEQASPEYDDFYYQILNNGSGYNASSTAGHASETDDLYDEVVEYVTEAQKASTSLLQRRFGIGYNRAARLIDVLEDRGVIGPAQGSKPREVYRKKETEDY